MAQLVIAAAGAAIGFAIGGPTGAQIGFTIGSAIGAPTQKTKGPRLEDLKVSGTEYGQTIPYCEGVIRTAGQVVWASDRREIATTTEQGGKGGGVESTTYTYEVDLLYLLTDNTISGVLRVWNNGKLIFTNLDGADFDSVEASNDSELWTRFTVYTGDVTQMPDPTYEAAVTTAYASAYRGRGSVFIESFQLGGNGQIPNLTFEVANGDGTVSYVMQADETALWEVDNPSAAGYAPSYGEGEFTIIFNSGVTANTYIADGDTLILQSSGPLPTAESPAAIVSLGNSDQSCLCVTQPIGSLSNVLRFSDPTQSISYTYASTAARPYCYAVRGSNVVFSNRVTFNLDRFARTGGYPLATTVAGTYIIKQIALTDTKCYALAADDTIVYEFLLSDMSLVDSFPGPDAAQGGNDLIQSIVTNEDGELWGVNNDRMYQYDGTEFIFVADMTAAMEVQGGGSFPLPSMVGRSYYNMDASGATDTLYKADFRNVATAAVPTLQAVVERLLIRCGLDASQYDASDLASITTPVRSMAISQVTTIRNVLETLASAYFFSCVLSDKLYFYPDGGTSVATLAYADLGAGENQAKEEPLELRLANELEIPAQVALSYSNVTNDYNIATEYSDRLLTAQGSTSTVGVPLGFQPSEAKAIAEKSIQKAAAEIFTTTLDLLGQYAKLEPTDIVTVTDDDGSTYRLRLVKKTEAAGVLSFDAVVDNASVLVATGTTTDYTESNTVLGLPDTDIEIIDGPILRDADNNSPGVYVSAKGKKAGWPGCLIQRSYDGVLYDDQGNISASGVIGRCTTTLADWAGGNRFDETSTVTVSVGLGVLSSVTRDQVLDSDANACKIGDEVLQFKTATFVSTGIYTLSGLLRGRRGTEWAMTGHAAAERFVLLSPDSLRRVNFTVSDLDATRYFRGITLGRRASTATAESLTYTGVDLKPFAPVDVRIVKTGESDPLYASVALLVRGNGANGSTTFYDISPLAHTVTAAGNAAVSTLQAQYNGSSILLDGTGDYLTVTRQAGDFDFGSSDFCVEAWVYKSEAGRQQTVMTTRASVGADPGFLLAVTSTNFLSAQCWGPSTGTSLGSITGATTVTLSTWHHVAYTRNGSTFTLWLDGVSQGTASSASAVVASTNNLRIGRDNSVTTRDWNGHIQECRITKGSGTYRYSAGFTPSGPWPTTSSTDGVSFTWSRRTRLDKNFTTGVTPLGESTESYEIDVYDDGTFTTVVRTLTSTTETVNYSEAQQVIDFGAVQSSFFIDVYQVSATLGRGYPARGSF